MTEQGKVVKISNDSKLATVRFFRKDACDKCNACAFKPNAPHFDIEVENSLNAKLDDEIVINMAGMNGLKVSLIVYAIPLFNAFVGLLFSILLKFPDWAVVGTFFAMLVFGFAIVFVIDKWILRNKKIKPVMVEIIKNKGE